MIIGFFLTLTLIGAILGIPIGFIGFIVLIVGLVTSGKKEVYVGAPAAQQQVVITGGPSPPMQVGQGNQSQQPLSQDTKFCQSCGAKMSKSGTFCPACGAKQPF